MTVSAISYQAQWNPTNEHLNLADRTLQRRVYDLVMYAVFYLPYHISKMAILPANYIYSEAALEAMRADFEHRNNCFTYQKEPLTIKTPDGINLDATLFRTVRTSETNIPTLILFNPNASLYKHGAYDWMLRAMQDTAIPFNIVMFDYRATGESEGDVSRDGLIIDGESIYQYVNNQLGVDEAKIGMFGWSLGGAVAAQVKAMHPENGAFVSDRSFSSVFETAREKAKVILSQYLPECLATFIANIIAWTGFLSGWEYDTVEAWCQINGPKLAICHQDDQLINYQAGLYRGIENHSEASQRVLLNTECDNAHMANPDELFVNDSQTLATFVRNFFVANLH